MTLLSDNKSFGHEESMKSIAFENRFSTETNVAFKLPKSQDHSDRRAQSCPCPQQHINSLNVFSFISQRLGHLQTVLISQGFAGDLERLRPVNFEVVSGNLETNHITRLPDTVARRLQYHYGLTRPAMCQH